VHLVSSESDVPADGLEQAELERRLLEIGFVEGARIEVLHEGFIGRDPIAVKLDDMRVALRRREARGVLLRLDHGPGKASR
jgi:ferrous iron transport protein A